MCVQMSSCGAPGCSNGAGAIDVRRDLVVSARPRHGCSVVLSVPRGLARLTGRREGKSLRGKEPRVQEIHPPGHSSLSRFLATQAWSPRDSMIARVVQELLKTNGSFCRSTAELHCRATSPPSSAPHPEDQVARRSRAPSEPRHELCPLHLWSMSKDVSIFPTSAWVL